jgi:hypothetical protein
MPERAAPSACFDKHPIVMTERDTELPGQPVHVIQRLVISPQYNRFRRHPDGPLHKQPYPPDRRIERPRPAGEEIVQPGIRPEKRGFNPPYRQRRDEIGGGSIEQGQV